MDFVKAIWEALAVKEPQEKKSLTKAIWNTGNYMGRWAIGFILLTPVAIITASFLPPKTAEVVVPMITIALPLSTAIIFSIIFLDPMLLGLIFSMESSKKFLARVAGIIGAETLMGIYFSLVPVSNDHGLIPAISLIWIAIPLIYFGVKDAWGKKIGSLLIILMIVLTAIFFMGGREGSEKKLMEMKQSTIPTAIPQAKKPTIWAANPIQVEAPDSAWVSYPAPSYDYGIAVQKGEAVELRVNGRYYRLDNYAQVEFGPSIGNMEFRGIGKMVVIYIYRQV
jgi:hypothetical protein